MPRKMPRKEGFQSRSPIRPPLRPQQRPRIHLRPRVPARPRRPPKRSKWLRQKWFSTWLVGIVAAKKRGRKLIIFFGSNYQICNNVKKSHICKSVGKICMCKTRLFNYILTFFHEDYHLEMVEKCCCDLYQIFVRCAPNPNLNFCLVLKMHPRVSNLSIFLSTRTWK